MAGDAMTLDFFLCECGKAHWHGARYCDRCGAQPPRRVSTGRMGNVTVDDADVPAFMAAAEALNEALRCTRGKWGCA